MIIDKPLLEDVVKVRRKGDRILLVKLILGKEIFNAISIYAPDLMSLVSVNFGRIQIR